jgi:hypothetical protein
MADGVFIVLDDEHSVAEVAKLDERFDQPVVVALMKTDGGLVENIENAAQLGADLRGEADALAFAAGESRRVAVKCKVG